MSYILKTNLAHKSNYGSIRAVSAIKYIIMHYTTNDGDTDENNGKYFKNNIVKASSHYFVDDDSVTQSVPDNYVAYAVGGSRYSDYKSTGGATLYGVVNNTNSISVELCDDVKNGVVYPSAATIENAIELVKSLQKKYNVPDSNVIRHFDVNGKKCPLYWIDNNKWQSEFKNKLTNSVNNTTVSANKEEYDMPTIRKGSKGKAVEIWQVIVGTTVDGDFGKNTEAATIAFQKKAFPNQPKEWDGIVGVKTWRAGLASV